MRGSYCEVKTFIYGDRLSVFFKISIKGLENKMKGN